MMTQLRQTHVGGARATQLFFLEPFDGTSSTSPNMLNISIARPINSEPRTFVSINCFLIQEKKLA